MTPIKLIKAVYENFYGYYGVKEIDLSDISNTIGVSGRNGGGKSTFLESFLFIFYGVKKYGTLLDAYNERALNEEDSKCSVSFYFSWEGIIYRIYREISKKGAMTTRLYINDELFSKKREENETKIQEILKVPFSLLPLTIFSKQREPHYFFTLDNPDKKKFFESFLQSNLQAYLAKIKKRNDRYSKKLSAIDAVVKSKKTRVSTLEEYLLTNIYVDYTEQITQTTDKKTGYEISLDGLLKNLEGVKEKLQVTRENKLVLESLTGKLDSCVKAETAVASAKELFTAGRKGYHDGVKEQIRLLGEAKAVFAACPTKENYSAADSFMKNLRSEIDTLQEEIRKAESTLSTNAISKSKLVDKISLLTRTRDEAECPVCKSKGYNTDGIRAEIITLEADLGKLVAISEEITAVVIEKTGLLTKKKDTAAKGQIKFDGLKVEYDKGVELSKEITKIAQKIKDQLRNYKQSYSAVRMKKADYDKIRQTLDVAQVTAQISELTEKVKEDVSGEYSRIGTMIDLERERVKQCTDALQDYQNKMMTSWKVKTLREEYEKELTEIQTYLKSGVRVSDKVRDKIKNLEELVFVVNKSFGEYVKKSVANIFAIQNTMLEELNSGIRIIPQITVSDSRFDFGFTYYINGVKVPGISGGQETLLGISFRTALWKFLCVLIPNPISFCFLDEIFEGLDQDNASMLLNYIKSLNKYFDYIFITSHTEHVLNTEKNIKMS